MCRFLHPWAKRNSLSTLRRVVNKWSGLRPFGVSNGQEHTSQSFIYNGDRISLQKMTKKEPDSYTEVQA